MMSYVCFVNKMCTNKKVFQIMVAKLVFLKNNNK